LGIHWKAFAQVEYLVSAIGSSLDSNMPVSVVPYNKTEKVGKGAENCC